MKKVFLILCMMVLVGSFVLIGYAVPTNAKTTKLLFASFTAGDSFMSDGMKAFAADLEKKSNGQITVEFSWGSALGKIPEYYDLTARGVCDVGLANPVQCAKEQI